MTILPHRDDWNGWRNRLYALTGITLTIYLYIAFFTLGTLHYAPYTIQDDARQFLSWMPRIGDPALLRDDLIANYWHSTSPPVFRWLYQGAAAIGITPLVFARLLPVLITLVNVVMSWRVAAKMTGRPIAAFVAAGFMMALLLHEDSVYSATPRAFSAPFFLIFLDGLLRDRPVQTVAPLVPLALSYPTTALVSLGIIGLSRLHIRPRPGIDLSPRSILLVVAAAVCVLGAVLTIPGGTKQWKPVVTMEQALAMPNLGSSGGRSSIVSEDGSIGWICSARMGYVPEMMPCGRGIPGAALFNMALLIPMLLFARRALRQSSGRVSEEPNMVYPLALLATFVCYSAAVAVAFQLHLPSRYSQRILMILEWMAIGQGIGLWLDAKLAEGRMSFKPRAAAIAVGILFAAFCLSPTPGLQRPADPGAIRFIANGPKDVRIAGVSSQMDFIPALTGRSVLATVELAIPYHLGYFRPIEQRLSDSLALVATPSAAQAREIVERQKIDWILVDRATLSNRLLDPDYASVLPAQTALAQEMLMQGKSVVQQRAARCTRYAGPAVVILDARCVVA